MQKSGMAWKVHARSINMFSRQMHRTGLSSSDPFTLCTHCPSVWFAPGRSTLHEACNLHFCMSRRGIEGQEEQEGVLSLIDVSQSRCTNHLP